MDLDVQEFILSMNYGETDSEGNTKYPMPSLEIITGASTQESVTFNAVLGWDFKPQHTYEFTIKINSIYVNMTVKISSWDSLALNKAVRDALPELTKTFNIVHLCGKGKTDEALKNTPSYIQFEYIKDEMKDLFAMADIIISRAGANAICEIQALCKPNILIPLPASASRGDQILNAESFKKQGFSEVLDEETLTTDKLISTVNDTYANKEKYINAMKSSNMTDAVATIIDLIQSTTKNQ